MKFYWIVILGIGIVSEACAQITDPKATKVWEPEPRVVKVGNSNSAAPSDAISLFDGTNMDAWQHEDGSPVNWKLEDGMMTVVDGAGGIFTKEAFGDCQLHIEWRAPIVIEGEGQDRGNSGVFLQNKYEVQILDSYQNRTYSNGQAGSIYKQHIPLVNAMRPPEEWQTYDIIFQAPKFNADGIKVASGYLTVLHNGVLIQNHAEIKGTTEDIGLPKNPAHGDGPIQLQDHSNPVSYRNIWIRKL
ncbi:MAG: DUF1080 domain-containing protein [Bacteroidia bacterium]|nr:DUF1080 domain-containing protein [Bacteroidia bacterium]